MNMKNAGVQNGFDMELIDRIYNQRIADWIAPFVDRPVWGQAGEVQVLPRTAIYQADFNPSTLTQAANSLCPLTSYVQISPTSVAQRLATTFQQSVRPLIQTMSHTGRIVMNIAFLPFHPLSSVVSMLAGSRTLLLLLTFAKFGEVLLWNMFFQGGFLGMIEWMRTGMQVDSPYLWSSYHSLYEPLSIQ